MTCLTCTRELPDGAIYCPTCGTLAGSRPKPTRYAGFWRRVAATFIDLFLILPTWYLAKEYLILPASPEEQRDWYKIAEGGISYAEYQQIQLQFLSRMSEMTVLLFLVSAPYYVVTESSELQGTLGKRLMGLRVTDLNGRRIRTGRALLRYFARPFSGLPAQLGFVLAALPPKKRALHDYLVGTVVCRGGK